MPDDAIATASAPSAPAAESVAAPSPETPSSPAGETTPAQTTPEAAPAIDTHVALLHRVSDVLNGRTAAPQTTEPAPTPETPAAPAFDIDAAYKAAVDEYGEERATQMFKPFVDATRATQAQLAEMAKQVGPVWQAYQQAEKAREQQFLGELHTTIDKIGGDQFASILGKGDVSKLTIEQHGLRETVLKNAAAIRAADPSMSRDDAILAGILTATRTLPQAQQIQARQHTAAKRQSQITIPPTQTQGNRTTSPEDEAKAAISQWVKSKS